MNRDTRHQPAAGSKTPRRVSRAARSGSSRRPGPRSRLLLAASALPLALTACGGRDVPFNTERPETSAPETSAPETSAPETTVSATEPASTPVFTQVSAGTSHSCAVATGGAVWCWGGNRYGQLGTGDLLDNPAARPVQADGVRFTQVSAGTSHSCAVDTDGAAWCWGGNFVGKLGTGDLESTKTPKAVTGLPGPVRLVRAGTDRSCAIGIDDSLWCWGLNTTKQIGDLPEDRYETPVRVDGGVRDYSMIGGRGCAVVAGGVTCYGNNIRDFAEQGIIVYYQHRIDGAPADLLEITQTRLQSCGRDVDGRLTCWGGVVNSGQDGPHGTWQAPATIPGLTVSAFAATESTLCMVTADFDLFCWGYRPPASWMNPTEAPSADPWTVETLTPARTGSKISSVSGGAEHFCALLDDGRVFCWGANTYGQLGDGTQESRREPVAVIVHTNSTP